MTEVFVEGRNYIMKNVSIAFPIGEQPYTMDEFEGYARKAVEAIGLTAVKISAQRAVVPEYDYSDCDFDKDDMEVLLKKRRYVGQQNMYAAMLWCVPK